MSRQRLAFRLLLVGAGYYVAATLSLRLALVEQNVTPFWPPTGIALVSLLVFGVRMWPAVAVAAFLVNLPISPSALTAGTIAVGNCLTPLAGERMLRTAGFREDLGRLRDALAIVFVALASTLVSASIGSTSLMASHAIDASHLLPTWSVWWTGDAMGILIVAPVLLALRSVRTLRIEWRRGAEAAGLFAVLAAGSALLLVASQPVWVLLFPVLGLIAWRFQFAGAAPAALLVSTVAMWAAVQDRGAFATTDLLDKMIGLQAFNAAVSLMSLFLATLVTERRRAIRSLEGGYEREHRIAETLQRSMLPDRMPDVPDIAIAARYLPATADVKVGGDWYDALTLADGRIFVAIGDVAGRGTPAAATMGQLRMAARAYALDGAQPATAVAKLNALLLELHPAEMATLVYLHLDPETGEIQMTNAGHPPPLLIGADGQSQFMDGVLGPPVGVSPFAGYKEATARLEPGGALVLFTDGLVERRRTPLDDGLRRLREVVRRPQADAQTACDHLLDAMVGRGVDDDVALIVIRRLPLAGERLAVTRPAVPDAVPELRRILRRWLHQNGVHDDDVFPILVASCEACTNVIEHAYGPAGGVVRLRAALEDGRVIVTVGDDGRWRKEQPDRDGGRGRGMHLIRGTMDTVDVFAADAGTDIRMGKRIGVRD